jgi:6-phosphogluconolactonase
VRVEILEGPDEVAARAAAFVANEARAAVAASGRFTLAVSGGRTPWIMLRRLACESLPWHGVHVFQVDERVAPAGHPDRNWTHLRESLEPAALPQSQLYPMPVESAGLAAAAEEYARAMEAAAGAPPAFDVIHLGLGADGHTASLVPGDVVLEVTDRDVAITGLYQGRVRMTLTYPVLNRARMVLWVVTGSEKREAFARFLDADPAIPASRVLRDHALVLADQAAAQLEK